MARKRELGFVWFFLRFIIQALVCPVLLVITLSQKTLETFLPFAVGATILILDLVVLVIRYRKQSKMAPGPEQAAAQPSKGSVLSSMSNIVTQLARVFLLVLGTSFWWSFFFAKEPVTERVHVAGIFLWYSDAPSLVKGCGISMILLLFVRGKPGSPWLAMFGVSNSCKLSANSRSQRLPHNQSELSESLSKHWNKLVSRFVFCYLSHFLRILYILFLRDPLTMFWSWQAVAFNNKRNQQARKFLLMEFLMVRYLRTALAWVKFAKFAKRTWS